MKLGLLALALLASQNLVACGGEAPPPGVRVGQRIVVKFPGVEPWTTGDVTEVNGWMVKLGPKGWVNLREASSWREVDVVAVERAREAERAAKAAREAPSVFFDSSHPTGLDIQIIERLRKRGMEPTPELVNQVRAELGHGPTTWTGFKTK